MGFSDIDEANTDAKVKLIQYQSMLYVSTSLHLWLVPLLIRLDENENRLSCTVILDFLKEWDNKRHKEAKPSLLYGSIDRYWFWRLDYYLWENRSEYFKDKALELSKKYIFRPNRSIEHIAPQPPKSSSQVHLPEGLLHSFGNLAMISSAQNSSLRNESYEVKKAHTDSYINGSEGGTIESLKMLKIHEFETWNEEYLREHHSKMVEILEGSFPSEGFDEVKTHFANQKKISTITHAFPNQRSGPRSGHRKSTDGQ